MSSELNKSLMIGIVLRRCVFVVEKLSYLMMLLDSLNLSLFRKNR